jgi:acyl-coenzyme A thioesterase PaaI-like protein
LKDKRQPARDTEERVIDIRRRIQPVLDHHPELSVEFEGANLCVCLKKTRTNLLGNFPGGEIAYLANAAAGFQCIANGHIAETVSLNVECLNRADGSELVSRCLIVKAGRKLIRLRADIAVRRRRRESLVAIAQITLMRINDSAVESLFAK